MKTRFTAICIAVVILALTVTVAGVRFNDGKNIVEASMGTYAAKAGTTSIGGFISEKVDGVTNAGEIVSDVSDIVGDLGGMLGGLGGSSGGIGGIGDAIGGIGDAFGGIIGGIGSNSNNQGGSIIGTSSVTYSVNTNYVGYIEPVPFASEINQGSTGNADENTKETVDFAATKNPYKKPVTDLKGGDKGEGVKWMQWIFIYTRYGLKDDGITGVFDEDTVAVVKKLQKEKGLTVDGKVNSEVIAQIELLYYQATVGVSEVTTSSASAETNSTVEYTSVNADDKNNDAVIILSIIVAIIWIIVIVFIVVLFIVKRKKKKAAEKKESSEGAKEEAKPEDKKDAENKEDNEASI